MPHETTAVDHADDAYDVKGRPGPGDAAEAGRHGRILGVLDRLLYDQGFRSAFAAEGPGGMRPPLDTDLIEVFDRVDLTELRLVGRNIRSAVVSGGTGTGQGLKGAFARTLETIRERHGHGTNEVAELFLASPQFQHFRDVPYSPGGVVSRCPSASTGSWPQDRPSTPSAPLSRSLTTRPPAPSPARSPRARRPPSTSRSATRPSTEALSAPSATTPRHPPTGTCAPRCSSRVRGAASSARPDAPSSTR